LEILELPGNIWLVDLPENGSNKLETEYSEEYDFNRWGKCLKHVLKSLDNVILVGHSFSGVYPLLYPEIEEDLLGIVIMTSASKPWIDNASKMAKEKNLPSFEEELSEFLANKSPETWQPVRMVFAHYYFTPETFKRGISNSIPWRV
jgi:predicted alpha/beta hydrolase family esterase